MRAPAVTFPCKNRALPRASASVPVRAFTLPAENQGRAGCARVAARARARFPVQKTKPNQTKNPRGGCASVCACLRVRAGARKNRGWVRVCERAWPEGREETAQDAAPFSRRPGAAHSQGGEGPGAGGTRGRKRERGGAGTPPEVAEGSPQQMAEAAA